MARLSDEVINQIKQQVNLLELIRTQGYAIQNHGIKDKAICCPFHEDKTASCVITPSKNLFNCFGCGESGSVIDWVMKTQGLSFRHAVEILQKDTSLLAAQSPNAQHKPIKQATTPKFPMPFKHTDNLDEAEQSILNDVIDYYHTTLKQSPEALDYLAKRGLNNHELINHFKLGFANRTLCYHLPQKNRQAGADIRGKLQQLGILRQSGHEHFNGSIVVPVVDEQNHIVEIYGRKLLDNLRKGTPKHTYLPGPHQGVWNAAAFKNEQIDSLILCESLIDAMTFWVNGFKNVTASYGTSGFTQAHLAAFKHSQIKRIYLAYDRDDAGEQAAAQLAEKLIAQGFEVFRMLFPQGMDANEFALHETPAEQSLNRVIRQAQWIGGHHSAEVIDTATGEVMLKPTQQTAPSNTAEPTTTEPSLHATEHNNELHIQLGELKYRIRGLDKNNTSEQLKINLLVRYNDEANAAQTHNVGFHVDNIDLYAARARSSFIKQASSELCIAETQIKADLGKILVYLESEQHRLKHTQQSENHTTALTESARKQALTLLKDPSLLSRILTDFEKCGVVGEETNKLAGYLAAVSRKLDKPLAVMIQSSSAAGKSSLMDAVLAMIPSEERVQYSAMTGQSLYYMGDTNLKHKILAISEEEGAEQASYALKLLQSEGEVSIASTGKNATTGNLETQTYKVEGPVMLFMTTTAIDIDEELLNRCLVLSVNESREQTQAIHAKQRHSQTLQGLLQNQDKQQIITQHQNAQRLLRPILVANPYAEQLTFLSDKTRTRRDHMKYLTLIRSITLLHQYQRESKWVEHNGQQLEYIEVNPQDIQIANQIAHEVLGRSLDELPPQTRKLLELIYQMVQHTCTSTALKQSDYRFSRKQVREHTAWGNTQIRVHMDRLVEMEYLLVHKGGRGQQFVYELLYQGEGEQGNLFVQGLINPQTLPENTHTTTSSRGIEPKFAGVKRPQNAPQTATVHTTQAQEIQGLTSEITQTAQKARNTPNKQIVTSFNHTESLTARR